jgi:hypothetical protein
MTYQIVRIVPQYHFSTDALIGYKACPLPMSYVSEALAHKLAGNLRDADYNSCGDDDFAVVEYGKSVWSNRRHVSQTNFDDMPF